MKMGEVLRHPSALFEMSWNELGNRYMTHLFQMHGACGVRSVRPDWHESTHVSGEQTAHQHEIDVINQFLEIL